MNLNTFESSGSGVPSSGRVDTSFEQNDLAHIKQKIEARKTKQKRVKTVIITLSTLVILLVGAVAYSQYRLYILSKEELGTATGPGATFGQVNFSATGTPPFSKDPAEILKALKRHILVPEGNPQIAEINDIEKLKETQAFFKDARNGDMVIVYETMIFIYRPADDIVVASSDISGVGQTNP